MSAPSESTPVRPTIKLKTSLSSLNANGITGGSIAMSPAAMTPSVTTPGGNKIKINVKKSAPPTPASEQVPIAPAPPVPLFDARASKAASPAPVTKTQKGRVSKPTAKKRNRDDAEESDDEVDEIATGPVAPSHKKQKLVLKRAGVGKRTSSIIVRNAKGEIPTHAPGEAFDSEDDERETDPSIEEQFILRMKPGDHCDYLRKMIEDRKIGLPPREGGAEFSFRWLANTERRAMITIKGTHYAAVLVDLPTITEGMKTWDRKNFMKSADICQMLLVFAQVANDEEARTVALPKMVTKDFRWPHGLTPPMHDCIHRRFRKRLSKKEIKDKEAELKRLLEEDSQALETTYNFVDEERETEEQEEDEEMDGEEDAEGEMDDIGYFPPQPEDAAPDIDDAELEAMFMDENDAVKDEVVDTPVTLTGVPSAAQEGSAPAAGSDVEASDADDDDDDDDLDEDELAEANQVKGVREDIEGLNRQIEHLEMQKANQTNQLLRRRIDDNIKRVKEDLRLKQTSIGIRDEE